MSRCGRLYGSHSVSQSQRTGGLVQRDAPDRRGGSRRGLFAIGNLLNSRADPAASRQRTQVALRPFRSTARFDGFSDGASRIL
jgi:hypothetical protein